MNGWLIVNRFLYTGKFTDLYERLTEAASSAGSRLTLYTNADISARLDNGELIYPDSTDGKPDYVIFWDKDIRLARAMEASGLKLYNRADAIEACDDKSLTLRLLSGLVRMPRTFSVPFTYEPVGYNDTDFLKLYEKELGYPYILKECFGSFGAQVHLIRSSEECAGILKSINGRPCIVQEYIDPYDLPSPSLRGRDIRINVVGGRCVASMLRYNDNDFRANITAGGSMEKYTPTDRECEMAIKACSALKLDFAGVDIMHDRNNEPVLCEVNSNAHFKSIYDCTGVNMADEIIRHILSDASRI